jgi:peptidoglycan/LPS O-acetylase OafA/YrhL
MNDEPDGRADAAPAQDARAPAHALPFRKDIEGLRAVAILLVVCAHAGVPWLAGGFVGVDVFFVLSGYLITGLLLREFDARGRIDLAAFYARRIQRLLPGLLLAVACTALAAIVLLAPFEQVPQAQAAAAATTWTSNFWFALQKLDYFGPAADTNLFLHTWSLGVEEQFYLLWPAWMLFLLGAWSWQGLERKHRRLAGGMAGTVLVCLLLSVFLTYAKPQFGFYMVFSRGWQFALGALVFLQFDGKAPGRIRQLAGWAGLAGILTAALLLDAHTAYPGGWAVLPSLGTVLVLAAGRSDAPASQAGALLSARPMQAIGRVSYAWYLWHWPVLLLGASLIPAASGWQRAVFVAVSLGLAAASYALVESPLRRSRWLRARPTLVLLLGVMAMGACLAASLSWARHARQWEHSPTQERYLKVRKRFPLIYAGGCDEWYNTATVKACLFGSPRAPHLAVLMGDSIAGQWFPALQQLYDRPGWRLVVMTKSSCPMVDQPIFYARIGREYVECEQWRNTAIGALAQMRPDIVIFSSVPTYAYTTDEWREGTARVLSAIAPSTRHIAVIAPTPVLPFDGPACLARRDWRRRWLPAVDHCQASSRSPGIDGVERALVEAVARTPSARLVDMDPLVCPGGRCLAERDGKAVYRDNEHLAIDYVETLARDLGNALAQDFPPAEAPPPDHK